MVREDGEDKPKDGGVAEDAHTSLKPLQTNGEQGSGGSARGLRNRNVAAPSPSGYTTSLPNRHVYGKKVSQDMEKLATGNGMSGATSVRKHLQDEGNEPSEHVQEATFNGFEFVVSWLYETVGQGRAGEGRRGCGGSRDRGSGWWEP